MRSIILNTTENIHKAVGALLKVNPEDKLKMTISDQGTKSARMRGLYWMWMNDISKAGIGGKYEDTPDNVHIYCKLRFGLPILIEDDPSYQDIYEGALEKLGYYIEAKLKFSDACISTEKMTMKQNLRYMDRIRSHYLPLGVNLTDPALQGLDI